jgi:hypothetical protein
MSNYSGLERLAARLLGRFPAIKKLAKFSYSRAVFLRARKSFRYQSIATPLTYSHGQQSSFFGYYDKSPENQSGFVLGHVTSLSTKESPSTDQLVHLSVFDQNHQIIISLPISAYNWQQGCRAQWLNDDVFMFNDFDSERSRYVARVYSVCQEEEIIVFDRPVQDSFGTEYYISLDYQRLMTLRPDYGYRNLSTLHTKELHDRENDGLWRVEYGTGTSQLLVSLADACKLNPLPEFPQAFHKFNHVMISPNGKRFIFMHRYFLGKRRVDRLLLADAKTGSLKLLSNFGMVSHCFWVDEKMVLGYLRGPGGKDGYWLMNVDTGEFKPCLQDKLDKYGDGHPHVFGNWFVTDTYPDKARMQHLLLCNWKTGDVKEIGEFFHGFDFDGESRCDLHPRFSPDGKSVFFDSVFTGKRQLYNMDLD